MKKFIIASFATLALVACSSSENKETAENKTETEAGKNYTAGEVITEDGAVDASSALESLKGKDSVEVKLTAKVNAVCQVKGCWMRLDMGNGQEMMVKFKDYAFFVPKDATGKTAVVDGWAKTQTISVAELKHYAEDDGKTQEEIDAITEPKTELTFEAKGVILK